MQKGREKKFGLSSSMFPKFLCKKNRIVCGEREKRRLDQSEKKKIWFVSEGVNSSGRCASKYGRRNEIMIRFPLSHSTETTTRNLVSSSTASLPTKTHLKNSFSSPSSGNANLCCASLCLDDCCLWAQKKLCLLWCVLLFYDYLYCSDAIKSVRDCKRLYVCSRYSMQVNGGD